MPKVSVIVTTYNRKEFLRETIQSILNQTFKDFELIVVDNYSNYDFFEHVKSFNDPRIRAFQNQNNGIIAVNRNFGIKHAKGEYIAFCDDDDIWFPEKLQMQMKVINETKSELVYSNMILFKREITNIKRKTSNKRIKTLQNLICQNQINTSSVLVKNDKLFFPEEKELIAIEDYALWLNLFIQDFRFEFIDRPLVYFRLSDGNNSKKHWTSYHLKKIYLFTSILIIYPRLKIKGLIFRQIVLNILKYLVKEFFLRIQY